VEGNRLYYVTAECQLRCLDAQGFRDGENNGPYRNEVFQDNAAADIVWELDICGRLGVFPHEATNSEVVPVGDLLMVSTSNGQNEGHTRVPSPRAPSLDGGGQAFRRSGLAHRRRRRAGAELNSAAIACISAVDSPSASSTTASGLPPNCRSVKTSTVTNRRFIALTLDAAGIISRMFVTPRFPEDRRSSQDGHRRDDPAPLAEPIEDGLALSTASMR
jgi:hypothetical protein